MLIKSDLNLINKLIDKYTQLYIKRDFLKDEISADIDKEEIRIGLSISNILSNSKIDEYKNLSLKFATIVSTIINDDDILIRCNQIMKQLSIFTYADVLSKKKGYNENLIKYTGISLFENLYREEFFSRVIANEKVKLNSFQLLVSDAVNKYKNISISAPTSIGKSFLMKKIIIDTVLKDSEGKVIYIVPTRALINEVMNDIQKEILSLNSLLEEKIIVTCSSEVNDEMLRKRCIFILTQERLNQLCCNIEKAFNLNLIIIDEAQQIAEGSRGLLLEYTIRRVKDMWPNTSIFFISPLIKNPKIFIDMFSLEKFYFKHENLSTVNQNVICIERKYRKSLVEVKYNNNIIDTIEFKSSKITTVKERVAYLYKKFNNGENSIIYCNNQSSTRKIANEIGKDDDFLDMDDEDLILFSEFLENYICDNYDLAHLIRKGIAYHYSRLPSIVKMGIEELAKKGKIKLITCTSTLLEGINVEANNIYIYNPRKKEKVLNNLEFWNLSGRAGRMKNDICGNIICINIGKESYIEKYSKKNIEDVEFKKNKMLKADLNEFCQFLKDSTCIIDNDKNKGRIESYKNLESILILEKIEGKNISQEYNYNKNNIKNVDLILTEKINENQIPSDLMKRLVGIDIKLINRFWRGFNKSYHKLDKFYLLNPFTDGAEERFDYVIGLINKIFLKEKYTDDFLEALRITAFKWIKEKNMKEILFQNYYVENQESEDINKRIEKKLDLLNNKIRYEFSKYIYAYQEILKAVLISRGNEEQADKLCNYTLYLEFGASKKKTLELMYLGIFREAAIILSKYIQSDDTEEIYIELKKLNLDLVRMNKYIKNKVREKIALI